MHTEPYEFVSQLKTKYPDFFKGKKVLEVGSLNINGSVRNFFSNCEYTGLDIGPGIGVDLVMPIHQFDAPNTYDVIISTEMLEHDVHWENSIEKMLTNLKSGGILIFSCAGPNRQEHGTKRTTPGDSPFTTDYYENRTVGDLRSVWQEELFIESKCYYVREKCDLLFYGIKK